MRTWAAMIRVGDNYEIYEVDDNKGYICAVVQELRDNGQDAGVMEFS